MALIGALRYRTDMICDLAETYGVLDYRGLPVYILAALCAGLRDTSRLHLRYSGQTISTDRLMLASAADCLAFLMWGLTSLVSREPAQRPFSFVDELLGLEADPEDSGDVEAFDTPNAFDAARSKLMGVNRYGG